MVFFVLLRPPGTHPITYKSVMFVVKAKNGRRTRIYLYLSSVYSAIDCIGHKQREPETQWSSGGEGGKKKVGSSDMGCEPPGRGGGRGITRVGNPVLSTLRRQPRSGSRPIVICARKISTLPKYSQLSTKALFFFLALASSIKCRYFNSIMPVIVTAAAEKALRKVSVRTFPPFPCVPRLSQHEGVGVLRPHLVQPGRRLCGPDQLPPGHGIRTVGAQ